MDDNGGVSVVNAQNLGLLMAALESGQTIGEFAPSVYVVEPTNRCNINCIMCPNSKLPSSTVGDTTLDAISDVLSAIAPFAELCMLYFMGETTLHPRLPELLTLARTTLSGKIVLSTNATHLSDAVIRAIVGNVDVVIACVDRWNAAAYEKIRRGSNFSAVVNGIEELLSRRGTGSSPLVLVKMLDIKLADESSHELEDEWRRFLQFWELRGAIPIAGWLNTWAGQLANLARLSTRDTPYTRASRSACADLWFKMVINWRGEVVLCCHDWSSSLILGSVRYQTIHEIWHSAKVQQLRAQHVAGMFGCTPLCKKCKEWATPDEMQSYLRLNRDDLYKVF